MRLLRNIHRRQEGQLLILSSILLLLSSIMIIPLVHFINTGIRTTQVYQTNTRDIYAADAGIQYGIWKVRYDPYFINARQNNTYPTYTYPAFSINDNTVTVKVSANWLFYYLFSLPNGATPHSNIITVKCSANSGVFTITVKNISTTKNVKIDSLGIWLPHGFQYTAGSSSGLATTNPTQSTIYGGTNLSWIVPQQRSEIKPGETKYQIFNYTPGTGIPSGSASWIKPQSTDIGASWENAVWWYDIISVANDNVTHKVTTTKATVIMDTGVTPVTFRTAVYEINPPS